MVITKTPLRRPEFNSEQKALLIISEHYFAYANQTQAKLMVPKSFLQALQINFPSIEFDTWVVTNYGEILLKEAYQEKGRTTFCLTPID